MRGWVGVGGQLRTRDELFVFGLTVRFYFFIHRVLDTWYFKNCCVNCVFTYVQL